MDIVFKTSIALETLAAGKKYDVVPDGSGGATVVWKDSGSAPTQSAINTQISTDDSARTAAAYKDSRFNEYPIWHEQLDKLWHDIDDGKLDKTGSWYLAVKAVKDKYAKP